MHLDLSAVALFITYIVSFALGVVLGRLDKIGILRLWD